MVRTRAVVVVKEDRFQNLRRRLRGLQRMSLSGDADVANKALESTVPELVRAAQADAEIANRLRALCEVNPTIKEAAQAVLSKMQVRDLFPRTKPIQHAKGKSATGASPDGMKEAVSKAASKKVAPKKKRPRRSNRVGKRAAKKGKMSKAKRLRFAKVDYQGGLWGRRPYR